MKTAIRQTVDSSIAAFDAGDEITATSILLKHMMPLARSAGMRPNSRFYRALRAARELDRIVAAPRTPIEGSFYLITLANGRQTRKFVEKGDDVFKLCKRECLEMQSFVKDSKQD